jgi:WD40 repeat protein
MDDALLVRRFERLSDLSRDRHHVVDRQRTACDQLRQILAFDELHHERVVFDAVDVCDMWMVERGQHFGLAAIYLLSNRQCILWQDCATANMSSDVFVSYARESRSFVGRLCDSLKAHGRRPWVDWEGIPPTARWMNEIESAIVSATAFAFVMSSDSLASRVCAWELEVATEHHKRLIPLVLETPSDANIPHSLRDVDWLFFRTDDEREYATSLARLLTALDTDPEWLSFHTRLDVRATEWHRRDRDRSVLLRDKDLRDVIATLKESQLNTPSLTSLQHEYALASERNWAAEVAQRKAREFVALARAENEVGNDELAALLGRQAFLFLEHYDVLDRTSVENLLRDVLSKRFFRNTLSAAEDFVDWIRCVAFSPDGRCLAVGHARGALRIWTLDGAVHEPKVLRGSAGQANTVAFSHDGARLVLGRLGTDEELYAVEVWEFADLDRGPRIIGTHKREVSYVAFRRDGTVVSAGGDGTFRLWSPSVEGRSETLLEAPGLTTASMSGDEQWLAAAVPDAQVIVMHLGESRSEAATLHVGQTDVNALAFSPDSCWLATGSGGVESGEDDGVRLWDLTDLASKPRYLGDHFHGIESLRFSPDGDLLVTGGRDAGVVLWNVATGKRLSRLEIPFEGWIESVAFSPDGLRLAAGNMHTLGTKADIVTCVWQLGVPPASARTLGNHRFVNSLAISATAKHIASGDNDGTVRVWTAAPDGGRGANLLGESRGRVHGRCDVSIGGDKYVVAGDAGGRIRLWDLSSPERPLLDEQVGEYVHAVTCTRAGDRFAAAIRRGTSRLHLWRCDTLDCEPLAECPQNAGPVSLAFNTDGERIAAGCYDGKVRVWRTDASREPEFVLDGGTDRLDAVAFGNRGRLVAGGGINRIIFIWDLEDPELRPRRLVGHAGKIESLAFSLDDEILASASRDKTARLWNINLELLEPVILRHDVDVHDLAFFPSDPYLLTASGSSLHFWPASSKDLADMVCQTVRRDLTKEEWLRYAGDDLPYEPTCREIKG